MIAKRQASFDSPQDRGFEFLPAKMALKLDDPAFGYNIRMEDMYRNVEACANSANEPGPATSRDDLFPSCFFSLPFIRAQRNICNWFESGEAARYSKELQDRMDTFPKDMKGCLTLSQIPDPIRNDKPLLLLI